MKVWYANRGSIRHRLLRNGLGTLLLIGLTSFGTGRYFWGMIDTATQIRNSTGKILTQRSLARNAEKDFRLSDLLEAEFYQGTSTKNLIKHQAAMAALEAEIQEIRRLFPDEDADILDQLQAIVKDYRGVFLELVAAYRQRGFKEWGIEGEWRRAMQDVEGYVAGTKNVFALQALLDLASHEKDYLLQNEPQYIDAIRDDLQQLKRMMLAQSETLSTTVSKAVDEYETAFTRYVFMQQTIGMTDEVGLQGELHRSGLALEPILQEIRQRTIKADGHARTTFLQVISLIWVAGLGLCGMILYVHAKSVTQPIVQLKEAAVKLSHGDFEISLPVVSDDEVGVLAKAFNQMASDLGRTQQALKESEEQSRSILETASDAFIGMDQDGRIIDWNHQAEVTFGWSQQEAVGCRLGDIVIPVRYRLPHATGLQRFLATGLDPVLNTRIELTALHRDGREFPVELTIWAIQRGQTQRFNAFTRDITERKQTEQMKSDFVSFVTHQLRTPLAGIKWLLELAAEEGTVPSDTLSYIQDARESANRLITLVNDLLDIARLEQGRITITPREIHMAALTHSVLEEVGPLIQGKGHRLSVVSADSVPPVLADHQLMRQVILNLVSNAIKYTPPNGQITIEIDKQNSHLRWSIHDSGIGIPKEALPRLFEKFYRADNALTIETEGTGLGLYLVRLILEQCAGRISCESEAGKGTTFHCTLPLPEKDQ